MSLKKWLVTFFVSLGMFSLLIAGFNVAVDPFGVFGDRIFDYYAYNMTQNPRIAKIAYLDKNYEKYDSYIIGSSKTSSYSVEKLNEYMDASFYNMIMYGGDLYDAQKTAEYVIDNYNVKNIILNIGIEESVQYNQEDDPTKGNLHAKVEGENPLLFYLKYAFLNPKYSIDKLSAYFSRDYLPTSEEVFVPETGAYNKSVRDVEPVGTKLINNGNNPQFFLYREDRNKLMNMDKAAMSIKAVKDKCEENGINFMLIASPAYDTEIEDYNYSQLCEYWQRIADVTDFYDFSGYSSISMDSRYFYDDAHFKNCVGDMALAYIFGDNSIYVPENFGHITTYENAYAHASQVFKKPEIVAQGYEKKVPVLMYHHLSEEKSDNAMSITNKLFEEHLIALRDNGYTAISFDELRSYVNKGEELPEKPVVITFDDGYASNYIYAYPLLKQYSMKATVFAVGVTTGKDVYKDTKKQITPHFGYDEAKEMYDNGVMQIQSHTYDFHRVEGLDEEYRNGASKLEGETDKEFADKFIADITKSKQEIEENVGNSVFAISYPQGVRSVLTDVCVKKAGFDISVTVEEAPNTVIKGIPQTLYNLNRIGVYEETTAEALIERIENNIISQEE